MSKYIAVKLKKPLSALALFCWLLPLGIAQAKTAKEIDVSVNVALQTFIKDVKGAEDYLKAAQGTLVMADVKKVGLVVGGQWGEGALRVGTKSIQYYKMSVGSVGFQAGYQEANFVFLFLTKDALERFHASDGWSAGVEGGITVIDASTPTMSVDTLKSKSSVVAFVFGKQGLMAGWSAKGTKFTRLAAE